MVLFSGYIIEEEQDYLPFEEARKFVHGLKLERVDEWKKYCENKLKNKPKKPSNIPLYPHRVYKDKGWIDIQDWLKIRVKKNVLVKKEVIVKKEKYLPFKEARAFVHKLELEGKKSWKRYCKGEYKDKISLPSNIPKNPYSIYANQGWINTEDWIGIKHRIIKIPDYGGL